MGHNHQHKNENDEELAAELLKEIGVPAEPKKDDEMHRLAESGLKQKREFLQTIFHVQNAKLCPTRHVRTAV